MNLIKGINNVISRKQKFINTISYKRFTWSYLSSIYLEGFKEESTHLSQKHGSTEYKDFRLIVAHYMPNIAKLLNNIRCANVHKKLL